MKLAIYIWPVPNCAFDKTFGALALAMKDQSIGRLQAHAWTRERWINSASQERDSQSKSHLRFSFTNAQEGR
jgi:hypothetical protein